MDEIFFGPEGAVLEPEPRKQLSMFVNQLQHFLGALVAGKNEIDLLYPDMLPNIREAWPEIEDRCKHYAIAVSDAGYDGLIDREVVERGLTDHGLTGYQLRFKFDAINFVARRFYDYLKGGAKGLARQLLKKLMEMINIVLRSLLAVVPGGGAIDEFKSILESLVPTEENDD